MKPFRVETVTLRQPVAEIGRQKTWDEICRLCPSLLVNFDDCFPFGIFPEPTSFKKCVPDGRTGEFKKFIPLIPAV
jgi:hypothetical protein